MVASFILRFMRKALKIEKVRTFSLPGLQEVSVVSCSRVAEVTAKATGYEPPLESRRSGLTQASPPICTAELPSIA